MFVNLVAVAVAAVALLTYAAAQLLAGAVFDERYTLYAELPRGGGLLPDKEVTYNGHGIGQVTDMTLVGEVVRLRLAIENGVRVPEDVDVVVQRSSAIGEQVLDIRPRGEITEATTFVAPGDTLAITDLRLPPEVQELLALAQRVFEPIDEQTAGAVVAELADVLRGRGDDLRSILRDSATLSEQLADAGGEFDRFFASSRIVNRTLAENRDTLAGLIGDIADATTILSDMRAEFEGVLAAAPPTLALTGDLVARSQPNLSCSLRDLANLNAYVARPDVLHNAAESLRLNRLFFDAFDTLTQTDPWGGHWQRLRFELRDEGLGEHYDPKRPTPPILPGGACSSPFGPGAPAATEPGHVPLVTDTSVIAPADDRAEPVRRPARDDVSAADPDDNPTVPWLLGSVLLAGVGRAIAHGGVAGPRTGRDAAGDDHG